MGVRFRCCVLRPMGWPDGEGKLCGAEEGRGSLRRKVSGWVRAGSPPRASVLWRGGDRVPGCGWRHGAVGLPVEAPEGPCGV